VRDVVDPLDKLDFRLRQLYINYLESQKSEKESISEYLVSECVAAKGGKLSEFSHKYNLSIRFIRLQNDLSIIDNLDFKTMWNEVQGFAQGVIRLSDLERIVFHPNIVRLEYDNALESHYNHSVSNTKARSDTLASIGTNCLWDIDPFSDRLAVTNLATNDQIDMDDDAHATTSTCNESTIDR
jgi:hypothetical protein